MTDPHPKFRPGDRVIYSGANTKLHGTYTIKGVYDGLFVRKTKFNYTVMERSGFLPDELSLELIGTVEPFEGELEFEV